MGCVHHQCSWSEAGSGLNHPSPCVFLGGEEKADLSGLAHFLLEKLRPESPWSQDLGRGPQFASPLAVGEALPSGLSARAEGREGPEAV